MLDLILFPTFAVLEVQEPRFLLFLVCTSAGTSPSDLFMYQRTLKSGCKFSKILLRFTLVWLQNNAVMIKVGLPYSPHNTVLPHSNVTVLFTMLSGTAEAPKGFLYYHQIWDPIRSFSYLSKC